MLSAFPLQVPAGLANQSSTLRPRSICAHFTRRLLKRARAFASVFSSLLLCVYQYFLVAFSFASRAGCASIELVLYCFLELTPFLVGSCPLSLSSRTASSCSRPSSSGSKAPEQNTYVPNLPETHDNTYNLDLLSYLHSHFLPHALPDCPAPEISSKRQRPHTHTNPGHPQGTADRVTSETRANAATRVTLKQLEQFSTFSHSRLEPPPPVESSLLACPTVRLRQPWSGARRFKPYLGSLGTYLRYLTPSYEKPKLTNNKQLPYAVRDSVLVSFFAFYRSSSPPTHPSFVSFRSGPVGRIRGSSSVIPSQTNKLGTSLANPSPTVLDPGHRSRLGSYAWTPAQHHCTPLTARLSLTLGPIPSL